MKCKYDKITFIVIQNVTYCSLIVSVVDEGNCLETKKFVGKATCNKDDKFDFEIGKRVALAKAELKLHKKIKSLIESTRNNLVDYVEELDNYITFTNKQIEHNTEYLKEERYLNYKK